MDPSVNIRSDARVNSGDHSSIIDQFLVAMFTIHGQHLVARLAVVLTVLQLGSRHVPRNSITMETLENWRKTEVRRDRHGTVVDTPSSSIPPSKFLHAASGIVDNTSAILCFNEDYSFFCMHAHQKCR